MSTISHGGENYDLARRDHYTKLVFEPSGERIVVGTSTGTLEVWKVSSCTRIHTIPTCWPMDGDVTSLAIRSDGRVIACVHVFGDADKNVGISLWDMETGANLWQVRFEGLYFLVIPWYVATDQLELVLTGFEGDKALEVGELARGVPEHWTIVGHKKPIQRVLVMQDLKHIVSIAYSNTSDKQGEMFISHVRNRSVVRQKVFNARVASSLSRERTLELAGETIGEMKESAVAQCAVANSDDWTTKIIGLGDTREIVAPFGTMDAKIVDMASSPDKKTLCVALQNDKLAFLCLEKPCN